MKGIAFAPGHISAFFEPVYAQQDLDRSGSRGAGITISLGAISQVTVTPASPQKIAVQINGKPSPAPVTKLAVGSLVSDTPLRITVNTLVDLPVSQGFGMSAAGALSATLALADLLHLPPENAIKAAHYAEVQLHTGLGDVLASSFGGIEIRRKAGLPPWGMLEHIPGKYDIVLCVIGKKIETKKILTDGVKLDEIASYGRYCTKKLLQKPSVEHLFSLAWEFTQKIGLADKMVLDAIKAANRYGMASMCMLGNSVFAIGDTPMLCKILSPFGKIFYCTVDEKGARVLQAR
ncbi:MAG TPA: pantoate kinase [Candidatus Thermoplasmatota archaeon]|nr:pantoate kinase [Candidatus Thermoplasmatota archaeon]